MAKSDFATAAANVKSAPHSTAAWDELEELARDTDKPDDGIATCCRRGSTRRWSR